MGAIREEDSYVYVGGKKLRRGYTTGSSAAAASKAATEMLLRGKTVDRVHIITPKGILLDVTVSEQNIGPDKASCAVRKDGGDDADDTNGALIFSEVKKTQKEGIFIDGGIGVGRVTRGGLDQPPGNAAINHVPRRMITECVEEVCRKNGYSGGISVTISVPDGENIAKRTFNPRLGIIGGISIIGTSGIVDPMSETALLDSIKTEARAFMANGRQYLLSTPGNYGTDFVREYPKLKGQQPIECSNFIGDFLDMATELGAKGVLLVGNFGKLVKLAGGIMNTHSRNADCRMEIIASNAMLVGADAETAKNIMNCISTDDALSVLDEKKLIGPLMDILLPKIEYSMNHRTKGAIEVGAITFSSKYGILGSTPSASKLLEKVADKQ